MIKDYRRAIANQATVSGIPLVGAARAETLNAQAPPGFHPQDLLAGAQTVLILARPLPRAVFSTPPEFNHLFYVRSFLTNYAVMDQAVHDAALILEDAGYPALPLPS